MSLLYYFAVNKEWPVGPFGLKKPTEQMIYISCRRCEIKSFFRSLLQPNGF